MNKNLGQKLALPDLDYIVRKWIGNPGGNRYRVRKAASPAS
jgi:hypothetical protein